MLILEFLGDRVKLLKAASKRTAKIVIKTLERQSIAGLSDEAVSGVISDLMGEAGIKKGSLVTAVIPRYLVTVRTVRLPSVDDAELTDMVKLQVGKQLPYPVEELIWDFRVIEKRQDGYSDTFLVIVHRNTIDRYTNILKASGLDVDRLVLNSEALVGWHLAGKELGFSAMAPGIEAVIDIDVSSVDVIILRNGRLEFSRSFSCKDNMEETLEEIRKTFNSYQKENSREEIPYIVLTGIEERGLGLKPLLEGLQGFGKIEFIHPFKIVAIDYKESISNYLDLAKDMSFACLFGMAYDPSNIEMNFLPPELEEKKAKAKKRRTLAKAIAIFSGILLVFFGIFSKRMIDMGAQLNAINAKVKETEPKVRHLKEISQHIEIIRQNLDVKGSSVDVLREVYRIVPQGVSLAILDFELEKMLTVRGSSLDLNSVFKFSSGLEASGYFERCQIKYAQKRIIKERESVDFEIECRLSRQ